jgi:uncharacterized protein YbjT (DUF2867 family)
MTRVLLVGGTGLVGQHVIQALVGEPNIALHCLVRAESSKVPASVTEHVAPVEAWPKLIADVRPDVAISCLGTTWKKSGKSEAAFRAVDHDLVLACASAARASGAIQMIAVSSVGASAKSRSFYLRTKGKTDDALNAMDFQRVDILRPGLLVGERGGDRRIGERLGIALSPLTDLLMQGPLRSYRSTPAGKVGEAIAKLVSNGGQGRFIHENDAIDRLAR